MLTACYAIAFCELYLVSFYLINLKQQKKVWMLNVLIIGILSVVDLIRLDHNGYYSISTMDIFIYSALAIGVMLYALWSFKGLPVLIFLYIFMYLIGMVATGFVFTIFSIDARTVVENPWYSLLGALLGILLLSIFHYVTQKMNLIINIDSLSWKGKLSILFLIVIFSFYMSSFLHVEEARWNRMVTSFKMLGGIIALYGIIVYISKETSLQLVESRAKRHEESLMQQEIHYELLQQQAEQTSTFIHDANKLLLPLVEMIDSNQLSGELAQLVENLKKTVDEIKSSVKFKTGSDFVDAHLQYLVHRYKNVEIKIKGTLPTNHIMIVTDVISLFSNLLENAFEAVAKVSHGDKVIEMEICPNTTSLYIKIKNHYEGKLQSKGVGFETTKNSKRNHGIGLQSVQNVVDKYHGRIEISTENNLFIVEITFPRTIYGT